MAKLTKEMLRNLIMEALDETGRLTGPGAEQFATAPRGPFGRSAPAPRMGQVGPVAGEGGYADSAPDDDRDAILALWDKVKGLEADVESLTQDPTVMLPSMGGEDVPRPSTPAPTVKRAATSTKFHEEPTAKLAENRQRRKRRR